VIAVISFQFKLVLLFVLQVVECVQGDPGPDGSPGMKGSPGESGVPVSVTVRRTSSTARICASFLIQIC